MFLTRIPSPLRAAVAGALLVGSAAAQQTWIVDINGGPGVDFQQIQPAVDAAVAGDIILVAPGQYASPVFVEKGVRLIGDPGAELDAFTFASEIRVRYIPANEVAAVAGFDRNELLVFECRGTVILDGREVQPFGGNTILPPGDTTVRFSDDVRIRGRRLEVVEDSRVEHVQGARGGVWLRLDAASRVHLAGGTYTGRHGDATCGSFTCYEEDGGAAVSARNDCDLVVSSCIMIGGDGGSGIGIPGLGAPALTTNRGTLRFSDSQFIGGWDGSYSIQAPGYWTYQTQVVDAAPRVDPTLRMIGDVVPGGTVTMRVKGTPGDALRLFMGRSPQMQAVPGSPIPLLTTTGRALSLGEIPPSGTLDLTWQIPLAWSPGTMLQSQVSTVAPNGQGYMSNSVPILVTR